MKKYQMILIFSCDWSTGYVREEHAVGGITSQKFEHDDKEVLEKIAESIGEGMRGHSIGVQSVIVEVPKPPEFLGMYKGEPIFKKTSCASDEHHFVAKDSNFNHMCIHCGDTVKRLHENIFSEAMGKMLDQGDDMKISEPKFQIVCSGINGHEWRFGLDNVNRCIHCGDEKL